MSKTVVQAPILSHISIGEAVMRMSFRAPEIASVAKPGQFVHIRVADSYHPLLRRPISISDIDAVTGVVTIIYRIAGRGTAQMATLKPGQSIDCMGPLGNGFALQGKRPLLVGGGMGLAPLVLLAKSFLTTPAEILMGGRTEQEMFWPDFYKSICLGIHITTDDGTLGSKGFTVDVLPQLLATSKYDMIYTCGPEVMMEGVAKLAAKFAVPCQVSLEDHMACGVGACLSCTCETTGGKRKKICSDGPVFWAGEVFA